MKRLLIALLICCSLTSCKTIGDGVKGALVDSVGTSIEKRLPEDKKEEFKTVWAADPVQGVKMAAEVLGSEELAKLLVQANADNQDLADKLRATGTRQDRDTWIQIALALLGVAGTTFFAKKNTLTSRILRAVVSGVEAYTKSGGSDAVKSIIQTTASAAGVQKPLQGIVDKTTKK